MAVGQYILDADGNPQPEPDLFKWALWLENSHKSKGRDNRIVQQDHIGKIFISTVFLGLDHSFRRVGPPVFHGEPLIDEYMDRYCTLDDAIAGHMKAVELVKQTLADFKELERMLRLPKDNQ